MTGLFRYHAKGEASSDFGSNHYASGRDSAYDFGRFDAALFGAALLIFVYLLVV